MRTPRLRHASLSFLLPLAFAACESARPMGPVAPLTTAHPSEPSTDATSAPQVTTPSTEPTIPSADDQKRDLAAAEKIAPLVDAFVNVGADFSHDAKHVVFRSNRDGAPQLYVGDVAKPSAPPQKLTNGAERVGGAAFTPDGKFILYISDEGADENWRIFRVKPDGTDTKELSFGEKLNRGMPLVPRNKPDMMVYSARRQSEALSRVFTAPIAGGTNQVVYSDTKPMFLVDVSGDGKTALVMRALSPSEQVLFQIRLDAIDAPAVRVYPAEGKKAHVSDAGFSLDAKRVFVATDEGGEGFHLLALEPSPKAPALEYAVRARYDESSPATAALDAVRVSPTGDRIVLGVDAGDRNEVRILDAATLKPRAQVKTPLGTASVGSFANDGKSFTLVLSTADQPHDIFRVDVASGKVTALRDDKRDGLTGLAAVDVAIEKIPAHDGLSIPLIKYVPKGASGKLPVIVNVHGGPASSSRVAFSFLNRWFVAQGYAVVVPNIRGSTGFGRAYELADNREKRGDAVKDLETVNKWTKAQAWCDPSKVVIFGGSYGGWAVLMGLSRQPTIWAAGVDLFGVYDLKGLMKTTSGAIRSIFVDEFGDLEKDAALLEEWSPKKDVDKIAVPLFVYAGANDPRVPKTESDAVVAALRARKIPLEYMVAGDEGHSLDRRANKIAFLSRVTRFLADRLKK